MTLKRFPAYECEGCGTLCGNPLEHEDESAAIKTAQKKGWMLGIILKKNFCPTCFTEAVEKANKPGG